jgi:hypothetical protein
MDFFSIEVFTAVTMSGVVLLAAMLCSPTQKTVFLLDMFIFPCSLQEWGDSNILEIHVTNRIVNITQKLNGKDLDPLRLSPTAFKLRLRFRIDKRYAYLSKILSVLVVPCS